MAELHRLREAGPVPRWSRALPRPLDWRLWLLAAALAPVLTVNVLLAAKDIAGMGPVAFDWRIYVEASHRYFDGSLYALTDTYGYRYSPVLAPALRGLEWIGLDAWRFLHLAAVALLPTWRLRLVTLALWPFWFDVLLGNVMIFVLLAAVWALRGSAVATATFLGMALLIPKPLMLPVLAWLLWQRPAWRVPFLAMVGAHGVAVLATGYADEWLPRLLTSGDEMALVINLGPTRWSGWWWMAVAAPVAVWLTWKGRLGWASLLASPYWLPYYGLLPLLELVSRSPERGTSAARVTLRG